MKNEEKLRIYHILRGTYAPGEVIPPASADALLRQYGITPQALGFLRTRVMFEDMPEYISVQSRGPLLYDLVLLELPQHEAAPAPAPAPQTEELTQHHIQAMLAILGENFPGQARASMAQACHVLSQSGYTAARFGLGKAMNMMRRLEPHISIVCDRTDPNNPNAAVYYVNFTVSEPPKSEPVVEVTPAVEQETALGSDLPLTFDETTVEFPNGKQISLAGYLEQVRPSDEDMAALRASYDTKRAKGGIIYCGEDQCYYFDTDLRAEATERPILCALEQVEGSWRVSHITTRKLDGLEDAAAVPPISRAQPEPEPIPVPQPEPEPVSEPEAVPPVVEPLNHPDAPSQWRSNVYFPPKNQSILAGYLGLTALGGEQLHQIDADYAAAFAAGQVTWDERKSCYRVPLTLTTPAGHSLFLTIKVSDRPGALPWWVSFISPPGMVKSAPVYQPEPTPVEPEDDEPAAEPMEPEGGAVPAPSRLSEREKLEIYNTLLPLNPVGTTVLLSLAASTLANHGVTPHRYGYSRILQLVADMPEYFRVTSSQPDPGAPLVYSITILPLPQAGSEPLFPVVDTATSDTPPFAMTERTIEFSADKQGYLSRYINGSDYDAPSEKLTEEQLTEFRNSYDFAVANGTLVYDPERKVYRFPLSLTAKDGCILMATIKRSSRPTPWYVNAILKTKDQGVRPGEKLKRFAYLGNPADFLRELAEHAEDEKWSFTDDPNDYSILWNYICYTFYRLDYEGKVYIDPEGKFAAFNTGLLSRRFGEDLIAYFEPNPLPGAASKWKFVCFCSDTNGAKTGVEKKAVNCISSLKLELPKYFISFYDTMFDPESKLVSNFMHIVRDNLSRFPREWLHKQCDDYKRTRDILAQIEAEITRCADLKAAKAPQSEISASYRRQKELFRTLGEAVTDENDTDMCDLLMDMMDLFEGAVGRTVERCRRNFKLAVPCYFPTRNVMSMLLPISFSRAKNAEPKLALVAERQKNGVYMGRTVLTMSMAYNDARLLCRPSSEWLNTAHIQEDTGLDDSLDD